MIGVIGGLQQRLSLANLEGGTIFVIQQDPPPQREEPRVNQLLNNIYDEVSTINKTTERHTCRYQSFLTTILFMLQLSKHHFIPIIIIIRSLICSVHLNILIR